MRLRVTTGYAAGLALAAALGVAGCTGATPDPPATSSPPAPTTTATSGTSTTTAPPPTTTTADTKVPAGAAGNTKEGAIAFTNYAIGELNAAYAQTKPELLDPLFTPNCKTCSAILDTVKEYQGKGQSYKGDFVNPTFVTISSFNPGEVKTYVMTNNTERKVVDSSGRTVEVIPPSRGNYSFFLGFTGAWRILEIKTVE